MIFNKLKNNIKGFTLVEMVIVIAILGILSSLGFTKVESILHRTREDTDYILANNLATAANLYLNDNYEEDGELEQYKLISSNYISSIHKPKSVSNINEFTINIYNGSVESVTAGNIKFYPKIDTKNITN